MSYWKKIRILDSWGDDIGSTLTDQMMVAESHRLSGGVFNGSTPDTNFYIAEVSANGTGSVINGTLELKTSADSGSSIKAHAQSLARYTGGVMNAFRTIARFGDTGTINNTRQFGLINGNGRGVISTFTDGFFFQLNNTTFSIVSRTNNSDVLVNSGSFNGEISTWTVDTNYHTFEIFYTNKVIDFYIDKIYIHRITQTNARICNTRHFKPFGFNFNIGVGSVCSLYSDTISINQHGTPVSQAKTDFQTGTTTGKLLKVGPGAIHRIIISGVTNSANVDIYDGLNATGYKIWSSGSMSNQTVPFNIDLDSAGGTAFETGLYLVINGANCNVLSKYE